MSPPFDRKLVEVIGEALRTITTSDAEGFFEHCGYRRVVQSLYQVL